MIFFYSWAERQSTGEIESKTGMSKAVEQGVEIHGWQEQEVKIRFKVINWGLTKNEKCRSITHHIFQHGEYPCWNI